MKKIILLVMALTLSVTGVDAQVKAPQPSPSAKVMQTVGLTEVTLEYSRPAMRGREIFGNLVPYGKLWRTGANKNPMISFSDDVTINDNKLETGTYAVFTKPGKNQWEIYFYTDTNNWGTPQEWDDTKVAAKITVPVKKTSEAQESFTMAINELTMNGAQLQLMWDQTMVSVPFNVPTESKTQASIDQVMAGPGAGDYYQAASFYLDANKDLKKAHEWISKAVESRPDAYWMHRKKSLIEAKLGDKKAAIKSAKKSLELAEKAGNMDYVKMNKDNLKKWGYKM